MKKQTNIVKGTRQTLFVIEFVCFCFYRVTPACALTFVVYENVIHFFYAVQLTWKDQWLIYSAVWHVSFLFTPSSIFFKVELGFLCSVLKEFQTCGVSSATDVAQLDTCILENIRGYSSSVPPSHPPTSCARFCQTCIFSSSPVTPACRGEHAGTRPCKTEDRYICL